MLQIEIGYLVFVPNQGIFVVVNKDPNTDPPRLVCVPAVEPTATDVLSGRTVQRTVSVSPSDVTFAWRNERESDGAIPERRKQKAGR